MKTIVLSFFILFSYLGWGQGNLNDYKYIIVPKKFEGFRNANEHQTSTLIKYLFTQKGFTAVYDDDLPEDLRQNRCLGLEASLKDDSSMFSTKTIIALIDCNGDSVYETKQGISRIKEYKQSYNEAINLAMNSFNSANYSYVGKTENPKPITVSFKNDVKKLEEKTPNLKKTEKTSPSKEVSVKDSANKKPKNVNPMVTQQATTENQLYESKEPVVLEKVEESGIKKLTPKRIDPNDVWYAQELPNGYQLVDSSPKIRMRLLKSSKDNVYMAQSDDHNGMVYQKEGKWIFEYYEGDTLVHKELKIKF
ncbi:hypothetical protein [Maribacter aestuarii]|uniref:hypothetical protein n=1 Tax=Maribacter aestuarii TaxID=1130723 RepID=UPI00248C4224|nr:hypothetical protein [Maribacter aestuarii]